MGKIRYNCGVRPKIKSLVSCAALKSGGPQMAFLQVPLPRKLLHKYGSLTKQPFSLKGPDKFLAST